MVSRTFDILVIGGGINGCGIARDAAGRGYSVLLAEMDDLASGTSSASTKLIHGGLRYLEHYEFRLVREALTAIGVQGLMVSEVKGYGRQSGHTEIYRGAEYVVNFVPKIKIEIVVEAAWVDKVVEKIQEAAYTGKLGDGKIFVLSVEKAVRVRTGEKGKEAI